MTLPRGISRLSDAVVSTSSAPDIWYMGVGVLNTGAMCTTADAPAYILNGLPLSASGQVCVTSVPTPPLYSSGGLLYDSTGRLKTVDLDDAVPPLSVSGGTLMDSTGSIVLTPDAAPSAPKGRLTFDSAPEGDVTISGGFEYIGGPGQVVGTLRTIKELYEPETVYTGSDLLGTVLYVGGGAVEATFNDGFSEFSMGYAAYNTTVSLQFYNDLGTVVSAADVSLPRTTISPTVDTYREWFLMQTTLPDITPRKFTKVVISGSGGEYAVDNITFGKLDPLGTL